MSKYIMKKLIDQSVLNEGLTVPIKKYQVLLDGLGITLQKGEKQNIKVRLNGIEYQAVIKFVDLKGKNSQRTVIQIRYSTLNPLCQVLNSIFSYSAQDIAKRKEELSGEKKKLSVKDEYIDIYANDDKTLEFLCHCKHVDDFGGEMQESFLEPEIQKEDIVKTEIDQEELFHDSEESEDMLENGEIEENWDAKEILSRIKLYISSKGFRYEDGLIENFYLSLKSKPFVILAGVSGTGKTRLVKLFAEAIGAKYKMVPVRPDWSDSSDIFGHINLNGEFVPGAITQYVYEATQNLRTPYMLCLDEMNLARVEYYMSDILSVIESRDFGENRKIRTAPLITKEQCGSKLGGHKYADMCFPENLYIIGTVNMDETTFPFSRKVLDRANTIEFSNVDLKSPFEESAGRFDGKVERVGNSFLKTQYLILQEDCAEEAEVVGVYCSELQSINRILQTANAHVGYRVRDEFIFYLLNNKNADFLLSDTEAIDNEIMQKILPRIQGSGMVIKEMLIKLFQYCVGGYDIMQAGQTDLVKQMLKRVRDSDCKYKKSAEKITFMVRRLEEDGFTSYWF